MSSRRRKLGFTLVELVVAVGLLAMIFSFSGVIFKMCIKSHRMAVANAEIMQKFRVITDQLNADFKGLRKDTPILMYFRYSTAADADPNTRLDQIMFFADGDFKSVQLYDVYGGVSGKVPVGRGSPIAGNVARIFYGPAAVGSPSSFVHPADAGLPPNKRVLARRLNILTKDPTLNEWPVHWDPATGQSDVVNSYGRMSLPGGYEDEERYEHDSMCLAEWMTLDAPVWDALIPMIFGYRSMGFQPPRIDMKDSLTYHKLLCEGVPSFGIQWAYRHAVDGNQLHWFPSHGPEDLGAPYPSHFALANRVIGDSQPWFGVAFNIPENRERWLKVSQCQWSLGGIFWPPFFPEALKFTFTIHDSRGVYPEGRTFTHIVYLGDQVEN